MRMFVANGLALEWCIESINDFDSLFSEVKFVPRKQLEEPFCFLGVLDVRDCYLRMGGLFLRRLPIQRAGSV